MTLDYVIFWVGELIFETAKLEFHPKVISLRELNAFFFSAVTVGPLFTRKIICNLYETRTYRTKGTFPLLYTAAHGF